MGTFSIAIGPGIGDAIITKSLLLNLQSNPINVEVYPSLLTCRGPNYKSFIDEFDQTVFSESPFRFHTSSIGAKFRSHWEMHEDGFKPSQISLADRLCKGKSIGGTYACLNMKVRLWDFDAFIKIADVFAKEILSLSKRVKLVLMGERTVEMNEEYVHHKDIFSLYPLLPSMNVLDLTVPALGIAAPSMVSLCQDCKYMAESRAAINVGYGGNSVLSAVVAPKTIILAARSLSCNVLNLANQQSSPLLKGLDRGVRICNNETFPSALNDV